MHKIKIDQDTCIGCGMCVSTCPKVFELNEKIKSRVVEKYRGDPEYTGKVPKRVKCVLDAEENCPVNAITVT
ncbi:MAG: ferredoxin [Candidatus Saliniplasma sp.]